MLGVKIMKIEPLKTKKIPKYAAALAVLAAASMLTSCGLEGEPTTVEEDEYAACVETETES